MTSPTQALHIPAAATPSLSVPASADQLALLRAMVRAAADHHGLTMEALADLVLAADEAATTLISHARHSSTLTCAFDTVTDPAVLRVALTATTSSPRRCQYLLVRVARPQDTRRSRRARTNTRGNHRRRPDCDDHLGESPPGTLMTAAPGKDNPYTHLTALFADMTALPAGDPEREHLRTQIIEAGLPIADNIAARYRGRGQSHDDLVQVARLGLVNAVNRFDLDKGTDFLSFAVPTMMGEVRKHFRDKGWGVRVPRSLQETISL